MTYQRLPWTATASSAAGPSGQGRLLWLCPCFVQSSPCLWVRRQKFTTYIRAADAKLEALPSTQAQTPKLVESCTLDNWRTPLDTGWRHNTPAQGPVVALGKFDAMHKGHRELATRAAGMGSAPWLLSFSGMAEVLGWQRRAPLVAPSDRDRVLRSWAPYCNGLAPRQRFIPFAAVRSLSPEAFVRVLAQDLQAAGVVVGRNYRFGYKAAGDTNMLQALGHEYGIRVEVIDLLPAGSGAADSTVSSSSVREALAAGQMQRVADLLGRPYRLVAQAAAPAPGGSQPTARIPLTTLHNQPPGRQHMYEATLFCCTKSHAGDPRLTVLVTSDGVELECRQDQLPLLRQEDALLCVDFV